MTDYRLIISKGINWSVLPHAEKNSIKPGEPLQEAPAYGGNMHRDKSIDKRPKALVTEGPRKPGATEWTILDLGEDDWNIKDQKEMIRSKMFEVKDLNPC